MIQRLFIVLALLILTGCDQVSQKLGLEDQAQKEARLEPEAKAVGSGCRHSGRAIEDCYSIYSWLPKAGVYAGWREMDAYMRENEIETIPPQLPPPEPPSIGKKKKKPLVTEGEGESKSGSSEKDSGAEGNTADKTSEKH